MTSLYGNAVIHESISRNNPKLAPDLYKLEGSAGVVLGYDPKKPDYVVPWYPELKRGHALCFSATGGGKNTNLITPALLTYAAGSVLCLDPKGENTWITADRRRQLGQRVVILDPWNRVNEVYGSKAGVTEQVSRFNPLAPLDPSSPEFNDDILLIADAVIITQGNDPHWTDSARELVSGLIAAVVEKAPGVGSFGDVRALLMATDDVLARTIAGVVTTNPNSLAGRKLRRFAGIARQEADGSTSYDVPKELGSIRSTAMTQTAIFDAARLMDSMETEPVAFDLADLARQRVSLFVVLPADKLLTHGRWMRLIIQLAIRSIAQQPTPPASPVLFILDELGTINPGGGLRSIEQAYGLMGGMGMRVWGFFQTINQLARDYPQGWEDMIGNSETLQIMKVNEGKTANYFSNHIGNATWILEHNGQWKRSVDGKIKYKMRFSSGGGNIDTVASQMASRPAILPQELMKLPEGEVVSLFSGADGFKLPTLPYFRDPHFVGLFRPNPLYGTLAPVAAPAAASAGALSGVREWFMALSTRAKIGVAGFGLFGLWIVGHVV